jgi:hypothetical protein
MPTSPARKGLARLTAFTQQWLRAVEETRTQLLEVWAKEQKQEYLAIICELHRLLACPEGKEASASD